MISDFLPVVNFNNTYDMKPSAIPFAIEKVNGIIIIIIKAGSNSVLSDQFNFSIPPIIRIAMYISAPEVA